MGNRCCEKLQHRIFLNFFSEIWLLVVPVFLALCKEDFYELEKWRRLPGSDSGDGAGKSDSGRET